MNRIKLALIEDDRDQRDSLASWLQMDGFAIWAVDSAEAFYKHHSIEPVDIVIVDLGLPGEDGLEVIRHLRSKLTLGIIVVSARSQVSDRLCAIEAGADNFLVKPVVTDELALYIRGLAKRLQPLPLDKSPTQAWQLNKQQRELISPNGERIALTSTEAILLLRLAEHNQAVSRQDLVQALGENPEQYDYHRLDVHLSRLRGKTRKGEGQAINIISVPRARLQLMDKVEVLF